MTLLLTLFRIDDKKCSDQVTLKIFKDTYFLIKENKIYVLNRIKVQKSEIKNHSPADKKMSDVLSE